jgi:acetyltransferase-like isoleucine patch superfamily enzyme
LEAQTGFPQLVPSDPRITVGPHTYGNPIFKLWMPSERIEIGAFCSIAEDVTIFGGGEHNPDWVTTFPLRIAFGDPLAERDGHPRSKGPTRIGNDVWIGFGATILSGVIVGDGAIIGARAVVTADVSPYAVVAGNPARVIRHRFPPDQVAELLAIRWWDWPTDKIIEFIPDLCQSDVASFLRRTRQR